MSCPRLINLLFAAAILVLAQPAYAQWTEAERTSCVRDCVPSCEKNPNISEGNRGRCGIYCSCACAGSEKIVSNFGKFNEEFSTGRDSEITRAIRAMIPACNTRAFGQ
jgi:hypothetical protein